jgi:hypothetical protein
VSAPGVTIYQDRSILLEPGQIVRTAHVDITKCVMACRERMSIGDVDRAYQKLIQLGAHSPWPCPRGHWDDDGRFSIVDGRHEYIASLMLGRTHILVAWVESAA